jgi:small ligand-binding sensory domain FIST
MALARVVGKQIFMHAFRHSSSTIPVWRVATQACLDDLGPLPPEASLGFVYCTDYHAKYLPDIVALCQQTTGIEHWVGGVGVGILSTGQEYLDVPALVMMVTDIPKSAFRVIPGLNSLDDLLKRGDEFRIADQAPWFGMVHGDPRNPNIAELIEHTATCTETGFLVGGLTSSRGPHYQVADQAVEGGLSGVMFAQQVAVTTRLTQGVSPLGPRHMITQCQDNIVLGLDHRLPLDVLKEDIGELLSRKLEHLGGYIFVGLPTQDSDTDDYLVRQLVGIDPETKYIAIGDSLEPGQSLMFCRRDSASAVADMKRMLNSIQQGLTATPKGAVYYSCLGRGANIFGPNSEELKMISQTLGDIPLVGFFANGEICRNRLYGWTGVLTVFA